MGQHKRTHCKQGHELKAPNLVVNKAGYRTCRICSYVRNNEYRRRRRKERRESNGKR